MIAGPAMMKLACASSPCAAQSDLQTTEYQSTAAYLLLTSSSGPWPAIFPERANRRL